ncbi:tmv resistance protein n [Phtheirospermum japonicum]|uniref:Tmv resistance protein n n=1 Tax=Phtheirospermum japonicum TaxID=374723 RepID=A0A830C8I5_9LAMI|nr:tmv resistance protein n [Phtheirospermum japonicum]
MDDGTDDTSGAAYRYSWDVFLSFRGEDTREGFVASLYDELVRRGVRPFRDDEGMERGDEVSPTLLAAIEDSAAAIAVISENYANSKWCLDELATIFDRRKLMIPVFYDVDPSDVRRQRGSFEADFEEHEREAEAWKVKRWRKAMTRAGNISGLHLRSIREEDSEIIEILVKKVLKELNNTPLGVAKYPVGLDTRLQVYLGKLDVKANDVRIIGFYGMGGIGKTTLAKALFNKLIVHFRKRSFISNVREESHKPKGLESLQGKLFANLNSSNHVKTISDTRKGILSIKEITHNEPVLIVLDDVDSSNQLDVLAGGKDWFHNGSRIIITSRFKENFPKYVTDYEVDKLTDDESVRLFSYNALGREQPTQDFAGITKKIVSLTGGLPLAIEVYGSSLFYKRSKKEWVDSYEKLKKIRPGNLQDILEISFEALHEEERRVFLDLACFFVSIEMKRDDVVDVLKGCGFNAETIISELTGKSLVKVVDENVLWMHDQLRDMGREIVRREDYVDSGQRSRLWDRDEILNVLKNEKGTRKIEGIILDFSKKHNSAFAISDSIKPQQASFGIEYLKNLFYDKYIVQGKESYDETLLLTKAFKPMVNLRLLRINDAKLDGDFKLLPAELKWLQWKGCPLKTLPPEFQAQQDLAVLDLSESQICQLWSQRWWGSHGGKDGFVGSKILKLHNEHGVRLYKFQQQMGKKLLVVNLYACRLLEEIPDLSGLLLEKLILEHCSSLVKIHKSIGDLSKLTHLNLKECTNLVEFPSDVSGLKCLEKLFLSGCKKLRDLPEDMSGLKSLRELLLDRTAITELPKSIFYLKNLEVLNLDYCEALTLLPNSIGSLKSLRKLSLRGSAVQKIPENIGQLKNLEKLNLGHCKSLSLLPQSIGDLKSLTELILDSAAIEELPVSIDLLCNLKCLWMSRCVNLSHLPDSICKLSSLVSLSLRSTPVKEIPVKIGDLSALESLDVSNCQSIQYLPDSIGNLSNLTELALNDLTIQDLPNSLGSLGQLTALKLNNCKNLQRLPASIGKLKNLRYLYTAKSAVTELPVEIGTLSNLIILKMRKDVNSELDCVEKAVVLPDSFSGLLMLENLDFHGCQISGKIPDDLGRLLCLKSLDFSYNSFTSLPSSLRGLSMLKTLLLPHCEELKALPPLPDSLFRLNVANCFELKFMHDVSNLVSLQELELTNCRKVVDIPGLENLKSLRRLYTGGCEACLSSVQKRLSKEALRHISYLCVPGSEIPNWFVQEVTEFSWPKNQELKGVIIGVVVSLNQQAQGKGFRDMVPAIVDIEVKIIRKSKPIFTTTLNLRGVPNTDQRQLYLCRFHDYNNLLLVLEHGDALRLTTREKPYFPGMTLKKHGIHLVFENDDDYDDCDEELQQSVSMRLSNFFTSL